jgi:sulfite reductase (ferredoxin)
VGECSAGLFDLIDLDLKNANRLHDQLAGSTANQDQAVYEMALSTARALLITRGIEAGSDAAVFESFRKHFVLAGLVDARFEAVVTEAARHDLPGLRQRKTEAIALLAEVEKLYHSMDNSLHFPAETGKEAAGAKPAAKISPTVERDYRSVACPTNFVKVKLDLERMKPGDTLRILLAEGEPIRNVPRSVEREGHKILEQERAGDDVWAVLIEKAPG